MKKGKDQSLNDISLVIAAAKRQEGGSSNTKDNLKKSEENGALAGESRMESHFVSPRDYYLSPSKLERDSESRSLKSWGRSRYHHREELNVKFNRSIEYRLHNLSSDHKKREFNSQKSFKKSTSQDKRSVRALSLE